MGGEARSIPALYHVRRLETRPQDSQLIASCPSVKLPSKRSKTGKTETGASLDSVSWGGFLSSERRMEFLDLRNSELEGALPFFFFFFKPVADYSYPLPFIKDCFFFFSWTTYFSEYNLKHTENKEAREECQLYLMHLVFFFHLFILNFKRKKM